MKLHMYVRVCAYVCECESYKSPKYKDVFKKIKSFSNNNRNFLEKITSFFKNVLIFFIDIGTL